MTRETKIGLLVGLAFIIVIGILLSDHINNTTDPVRAEMTNTFNEVERSVGSPDARSQGTMAMVPAPAPIIPQHTMQTSPEPLPPGNAGSSVIVVSPGGDPSGVRISNPPVAQGNSHIEVLPPSGNEVAANDPDNSGQGAAHPDRLQELVNQHRDELGVVGGSQNGAPAGPGPGQGNITVRVPGTSAVRQVKAEEGDTVSRMAGKYMGGNNKANREAIIKANPSMTPDGHLVIAGHTYTIPVSSAFVTNVAHQEPAASPRPAAPAPAATPPGVNWYTVKDNDSLWKIAAEQLGSGTRWSEIRDLNQDVLKGTAQLHANMRIKLPAKSVASAN
jgi:nucleoid-associated protein YgaU